MENIFVEFLPPWVETGLQPAFYDKESGTVLQQTARMYDRVNMLVRMFNKLSKNTKTTVEDYINQFNELHDYVQDYFDNLDVQEEINNKLDDMAENGELANLITPVILEGYNVIDGGHLTPEYLFTRYRQTGTTTSFDNTIPREMEGIVKTGEDKFIVFYRPSTVTPTSGVLIEEIDYSDNKNATIDRYATITGLKSANSACYDPNTGKIYVWIEGATFGVVDYDNLTLDDTFTIPNVSLASAIAYDSVNNKFYVTEGKHVWELNITSLSTNLVFEFPDNKIKNGLQGFDVRNSKFYFITNDPRAVFVVDKNGAIENIKSINIYDNVGHYSAYVADFTFEDDNNIIITPHVEGDYVEFSRLKSSYYVNYVARLNLNGNNINDIDVAGIYQGKELNLDTSLITDGILYEDGSSTYKLPLVSEYQNNKFKKLYSFRCATSSTVNYYGTIILYDDELSFANDLVCEGGTMRGAKIYAPNITMNSARFSTYGTEIRTGSLKLGYNNASDKNTFTASSLILGSISDLDGVEANAVFNLVNSFRYDMNCYVLFSTNNIAGESDVTVGDIRSFKKIKVIATDSTSQQFCEEAIVPSSGDVAMNFNRITFANTSNGRIATSRLVIARTTGVITLDREYSVEFTNTPAITITASSPQRLHILRVEGYK